MDDEGTSTPGNVDICKIEVRTDHRLVARKYSKAKRKKIFAQTDFGAL